MHKITASCAPLVRDLWSEVRRDLNPLRTAYINAVIHKVVFKICVNTSKKSIKRTSWYVPGRVPPLAPSLRHCRFAACPVLPHLPLRCVPVLYYQTMSAAGAILLVTSFLLLLGNFCKPHFGTPVP